ncbi:hypothetical protein OHS33_34395 [Streptomyces sp. NBC_00536]|uniref:hypothetical protein n=1 Tax=Streptomyces sp. NBC_00536 TaxID=2975769 RepID=UPI002E8214C6|nr:hypothetical protein [Streptomyces sp. NBC_00536]WUC83013.1 hypothetical protein OHS33_34395 [Streptomyces sp. NBC_00536]
MPDLRWLRGRLGNGPAYPDPPSRVRLRERERMVRAEWEALREQLAPAAAEHLARVGELLADPRLEFTPALGQNAVRRDYLAATEAYHAAGKLLDEAQDLPDLAACVVLADRAVELFAAARARHLGQRPPAPRPRCFYNPLHGTAAEPPRNQGVRKGRKVVAREAAAARRPACEPCRLALIAGESPNVLPALWTVRDARDRPVTVLVPYYSLPRQASIWSGTACGSYDDEAAGRVLRGEHRRRTVAPPAG